MGMTIIYLSDGTHVPVTVLSLDSCQVIAQKHDENLNFFSVTLGSGIAKAKNTLKPQREAYAKIKIEPKKKTLLYKNYVTIQIARNRRSDGASEASGVRREPRPEPKIWG